MDAIMFQALAPLVTLGIGIVAIMLQIAITRRSGLTHTLALLLLALSFGMVLMPGSASAMDITPLLVVDGYARLFTGLVLVAAFVTLVMSERWLAAEGAETGEYVLLILLATFGAVVLVHSQHLAALLLGLEILGVSMYTLIAYPQRQPIAIEAGLKYLVLSSASTAILLFGGALLYAGTGTLGFSEMGDALAEANVVFVTIGALMVLAGVAFKLSLVPFHMWTPDVYEGAPTPVTGFLATVSKVAIFAALLRWYQEASLVNHSLVVTALGGLAIASMLVGNLLALKQENLKRLLGYSSIAHMGYLLIALIVLGITTDGAMGFEAAVWYLIAYTVSTLAAFAALTGLAHDGHAAATCQREALAGLFWREPLLALLLTVSLLSLAGVPLTVGFIGKFYLVTAGVEAQVWSLLTALVVGSAISIFYYLRVIYTLASPAEPGVDKAPRLAAGSTLIFVSLITAVLFMGMFPSPIIDLLARLL